MEVVDPAMALQEQQDEAGMRAVCERGFADIEAGRIYETTEAARAAVKEKAAAL